MRLTKKTVAHLMGWLAVALLGLTGCGSLPEDLEILPLLTQALGATATPTATPSPTLSPTATPTPSPTPTPTPMPADVLNDAERAFAVGDWERAVTLYSAVRDRPGLSEEQTLAATLGLGRSLLARRTITEAVTTLEQVVARAPESAAAIEARLKLGDAFMHYDAPQSAIPHYQAVLDARPSVAPYAHEWLGDAYAATEVYTQALSSYEAARRASSTTSRQVYLQEKIALVHTSRQAYTPTLTTYDAILDVTQVPGYRARILYQSAQAALQFGEVAEAHSRLRQLIEAYPTASRAHDALVVLVEAGVPVDEMLRGMINYHAGAYSPAVQAFYRVIEGDPNHTGEPHYYAGLSFLEAGSPELALSEFETLIEAHPDDAYWGSAWIGKARALRALGRIDEALTAYRTLPERLPDHPRAAAALWAAAVLEEERGALSDAAAAFEDLAERYPDDSDAPEARFRAGLHYYRAEEMEAALAAWQALRTWYPAAERATAAHFWLGKTRLEQGDVVSATATLSATAAAAPWDYYGLRASALLEGRAPLTSTRAGTQFTPLPCSSAAEQEAAQAWLANWLPREEGSPPPDVSVPPEPLRGDPRLERGTLLLRWGHFDEGRAELEALRNDFTDDPVAQYHLALIFREAGLYRSSIIAAATVWRLSPAEQLSDLPRFLGCLVYPTYFSDLVEREAGEFDFDPLAIYALLRQESLFEGFATSFAAAHGLMQVIPPTGAEIFAALGWPPNYETTDLYRPMVSVRYGVWYLAQQRDRFGGELYPAIAGYNGGPGNAARWWEAAGGDRDLFVELIGFTETRTYVERLTEHYAHYRWLYTSD